ncbi:GNAT family N-acetyltransferase [Lysobacter sp. S4-A87]|uniref:GNAT family N-acetyltransferase n=1 Tax=Lysobacter sp. S4-A87 TaxID=2925843 RepID=UPI001F533D3A|nr:GNAT family N-acetyltransferase [Lysobacter sp. S4-A87]UNK49965.1 GNAT family N-acetyltransferase [Lysobacter sp. S4-A87]
MASPRIIASLSDIPASQWDALHDGRNPFVTHAFLSGLEQHGCLRAQWGWTPQHLTLWEDEELLAAAPAYLKGNSHGEFVFDHAWAHAYAQHGLEYFPKWLCAAPYSPVTGPRLLARDPSLQSALVTTLAGLCAGNSLSSAHVNFHRDDEDPAFDRDWLSRIDVQYHWRNDRDWTTFDDYLAAFDHKHRKNIRQERARVERAGVTFRVVEGRDASEQDLAAMHDFYLQTFAEYGNRPALTLEFLRHLARSMPASMVMFLAIRDDRPIAGALCLRGGDTLYGRYWGAHETAPGLHFETCYYQGIDYCLRNGLTRFEPGAQGEHKLARGFLPTIVRSRHWVADEQFRAALRDWCAQESDSVRRYAATLASHSPFKAT